jgi:hypothetical protein
MQLLFLFYLKEAPVFERLGAVIRWRGGVSCVAASCRLRGVVKYLTRPISALAGGATIHAIQI